MTRVVAPRPPRFSSKPPNSPVASPKCPLFFHPNSDAVAFNTVLGKTYFKTLKLARCREQNNVGQAANNFTFFKENLSVLECAEW